MRLRWLTLGIVGAALAAGASQAADTLPTATLPTATLPTATLPTASVPAPTVPTVTVPSPTLPAVTAPAPAPPVPAAPVPSVPVPTTTVPPAQSPAPAPKLPVDAAPSGSAPGPAAAAIQSVRTSGGSAPARSSARPAAAPRTWRVDTAPAAATAPRRARKAGAARPQRVKTVRIGRPLVLRFRTPSRGRIAYSIVQLWPLCRPIATFERSGRAGANTLRIGPRIRGRRLVRGTYRIVGRSEGRIVLSRRFVVTNRALPARAAQAQAARSACRPAPSLTPVASGALQRMAVAASAGTAFEHAAAPGAAAPETGANPPDAGAFTPHVPHVLGETFTKRFEHASSWLRVALLGSLGFAIALLTLAALPLEALPDGHVAAFVARRRVDIALSGLVIVAAVAIAVLIS